jgi:hypothetical protein
MEEQIRGTAMYEPEIRRVLCDLTFMYRNRRYPAPAGFSPGDAIWVQPLPGQNAVRYLSQHEPPPGISASADPLRNPLRIDRTRNKCRHSDTAPRAGKRHPNPSGPAHHGLAQASSPERTRARKKGNGPGADGLFSQTAGEEIVLPLPDYDIGYSDK